MVVLALCAYVVVAAVLIDIGAAWAQVRGRKAGFLGRVLIAACLFGPSPVSIAIWTTDMSRDNDMVALVAVGVLCLAAAAVLSWCLERAGFVRWAAGRLSCE